MNYSKLMKERIRRVRVLLKELGYEVYETEKDEETYTATFEDSEGFQGGFFIDRENKFLEIAFTFAFSDKLGSYIKTKLEEMLKICYEFGCYMNINKESDEITFSVFSKIYFAGLNYFALRETLRDFTGCVLSIKDALEITKEILDDTDLDAGSETAGTDQ